MMALSGVLSSWDHVGEELGLVAARHGAQVGSNLSRFGQSRPRSRGNLTRGAATYTPLCAAFASRK